MALIYCLVAGAIVGIFAGLVTTELPRNLAMGIVAGLFGGWGHYLNNPSAYDAISPGKVGVQIAFLADGSIPAAMGTILFYYALKFFWSSTARPDHKIDIPSEF